MKGFLVPANANEIAAGGATHFEIVFSVKQSTVRLLDNSSGSTGDLVAPQNSTAAALPASFLDTVWNRQTAGSDVVNYLRQAVQAQPWLLAAPVAAVGSLVIGKLMYETIRPRAQDLRPARITRFMSHVSNLPGVQQVISYITKTFGRTLPSPTPSIPATHDGTVAQSRPHCKVRRLPSTEAGEDESAPRAKRRRVVHKERRFAAVVADGRVARTSLLEVEDTDADTNDNDEGDEDVDDGAVVGADMSHGVDSADDADFSDAESEAGSVRDSEFSSTEGAGQAARLALGNDSQLQDGETDPETHGQQEHLDHTLDFSLHFDLIDDRLWGMLPLEELDSGNAIALHACVDILALHTQRAKMTVEDLIRLRPRVTAAETWIMNSTSNASSEEALSQVSVEHSGVIWYLRGEMCLMSRCGVAKGSEEAQALESFRRALKRRFLPASVRIAALVESTDALSAYRYVSRAAQEGDALSMARLHDVYLYGDLQFSVNTKKAIHWARQYAQAATRHTSDGPALYLLWLEDVSIPLSVKDVTSLEDEIQWYRQRKAELRAVAYLNPFGFNFSEVPFCMPSVFEISSANFHEDGPRL